MGNYVERCRELRAVTERHYGCSHATFIPAAEAHGLDHETAFRIGSPFRAGMLTGTVCGAVTGSLMALGLSGADDETVKEFQRIIKERHEGDVSCAGLLARLGDGDKKSHCDALCAECAALVEELLKINE
ncbi:MAG: C_GCAxxG_C_C family protein [Oscillospiraceae bacterium]|nr:C_GCAxxG_C_C family protein [Oscillospiraceae bacterium]